MTNNRLLSTIGIRKERPGCRRAIERLLRDGCVGVGIRPGSSLRELCQDMEAHRGRYTDGLRIQANKMLLEETLRSRFCNT